MAALVNLEFPITVKVNGVELIQYSSFRITKNVTNFSDTFTFDVSNPRGPDATSTFIPVGAIVEFYSYGSLFFRGLVETKDVSLESVGSHMVMGGREEICALAESDADPTMGPFKGLSDNAIITKMFDGFPWTLVLGDPKIIQEYNIPSGSSRKGEVIDEILKFNDFIFIKRGNTLYKRSIPTVATTAKQSYEITMVDGFYTLQGSRVLTVKINEDITAARSKIIGFIYKKGKKKEQGRQVETNTELSTGLYAKRVRNETSLRGYKLDRTRYITSSAKHDWELTGLLKRGLRESDIKCSIVIDVYGIVDIALLDGVHLNIDTEKINQTFRVSGIEYVMSSENKLTTTISLTPYKAF